MNMEKLIALHKHWCVADAVRVVVGTQITGSKDLSKDMNQFAQMHSSFFRLSVFYGLLFVVIEGYKEMELKDHGVDELLEQKDFVDALRLFRNATFHFQKDPISQKIMTFLLLETSETWISDLHQRFRRFFEGILPIKEFLNTTSSEQNA